MTALASIGDLFAGVGLTPGLIGGLTKTFQGGDILYIAVRVALIGILTALVRAGLVELKRTLTDAIFPSCHIEATDPAFNWIMAYLSRDPGVQAQMSTFRLMAADSRETKRDELAKLNSRIVRFPREKKEVAMNKSSASFVTDDIVAQIVPMNERHIRINFKGRTLWVYRSLSGFANDSRNPRALDHLRITGLFYNRKSTQDFVVAAHEVFFKKADSELLIFHPSPADGNWLDPISRPVRTWSSVILPGKVKDEILEDVRGFLSDEEKAWYAARGIPHRRGYLLHGRPGAGKTTLATAIASELKLDIYVINPSARGMDDGKLNKAFRTCPPGNMILIEDIDCVMPSRGRGSNRPSGIDEESDDEESSAASKESELGQYGHAKSSVTLAGLLNAIDGVSSQEDCVLFASTNYIHKLDEALSRPGRFDIHAEFFDSTYAQSIQLFKHFYPLSELQEEPEKKQEIIDFLSRSFADKIFDTPLLPDGSSLPISMAALQGFLLKHKKDPKNGATLADGWVKGLWEVQKDKIEQKMEKVKARLDKAALVHDSSAGELTETGDPQPPLSPVSIE